MENHCRDKFLAYWRIFEESREFCITLNLECLLEAIQ